MYLIAKIWKIKCMNSIDGIKIKNHSKIGRLKSERIMGFRKSQKLFYLLKILLRTRGI